jgi:hypothetical protein
MRVPDRRRNELRALVNCLGNNLCNAIDTVIIVFIAETLKTRNMSSLSTVQSSFFDRFKKRYPSEDHSEGFFALSSPRDKKTPTAEQRIFFQEHGENITTNICGNKFDCCHNSISNLEFKNNCMFFKVKMRALTI